MIGWTLTPYMGAATLSYAIMVAGLIERGRRTRHAPLMLAAVSIDLGLVAALELRRSAVDTALSDQMTAFESVHVLASAGAAALYLPVIFLGVALLTGRGRDSARVWHRRLALTAFALRTIGYLFMFSMVTRVLG